MRKQCSQTTRNALLSLGVTSDCNAKHNVQDRRYVSTDVYIFNASIYMLYNFSGGVNFWLRSIYAYAQGAAPGIPPIFLVGTHKDRLPGVGHYLL